MLHAEHILQNLIYNALKPKHSAERETVMIMMMIIIIM